MPSSKEPVVLITGSSGLIGSRVATVLKGRYHVVGLDRDQPDDPTLFARFLPCDLTESAQVQRALRELRAVEGDALASVIHLAAYYDFSGEPSDLYQELTVKGTRRLLQGLAEFRAVEQFVFSSTMLVMKASADGTPIEETSAVHPEWDYPQSKVDAENEIQSHRGAIPAVILRIAGVYDDQCHSIPIAQQIRRIYEKKLESYFFPGNPDHGQAFVHAADLADCFAKVVDARHQLDDYEVFLVAEPDVVSYGELQDKIGVRLHGEEWPTIRLPAPIAKAGAWVKDKLPITEDSFIKPWMIDLADAHYPISIDRIRTRLGWEPEHRLRAAIDRILDVVVADPERFYIENKLPLPPELARD